MPKCPECGEIIDRLELSYQAIRTWELTIRNNSEDEILLDTYDDEFINAVCPECYEEIFTSKKAAIEFLRG